MNVWLPVLLASIGCYALKFAGLSAPQRLLDRPAVRAVVELIPLALLAALIAVQTFATDQRLVLDARAVGLCAAAVAVLLRAPFVVVVAVAALAAALTRIL